MGLKDIVHGILDKFEADWKTVKGSPELSEDEKDLAASLRSQLVDVAHTVEGDAKADVSAVEADVSKATEAAPVAQVVSDASGQPVSDPSSPA